MPEDLRYAVHIRRFASDTGVHCMSPLGLLYICPYFSRLLPSSPVCQRPPRRIQWYRPHVKGMTVCLLRERSWNAMLQLFLWRPPTCGGSCREPGVAALVCACRIHTSFFLARPSFISPSSFPFTASSWLALFRYLSIACVCFVEYSSWVDSLLCFGGYFVKAEIDYLHVMKGWGGLHDEPNQVSLQCRKCWSVYRNFVSCLWLRWGD